MRYATAIRATVIAWWLICPFGISRAREAGSAPAQVSRSEAAPSDRVCGPRCAWLVLRYYGHDVDLMDLVREIQWPEFERGASLAAIQDSLERRGVHTSALWIAPTARLHWGHPVIMHLESNSLGGHFVVRGPSQSPDHDVIWTTIDGSNPLPVESRRAGRSGYVFLTSPEPITDPASAAIVPEPAWLTPVTIGAAIMLPILLVLIWYSDSIARAIKNSTRLLFQTKEEML